MTAANGENQSVEMEAFMRGGVGIVAPRLVSVTDHSRDEQRQALINPRYVVGAEQVSPAPESKWKLYVGRSLEYVVSPEDVQAVKQASAL